MVVPHFAGSSITADAAASASARNVSGNACTSLRRAALASGVAAADGPGDHEQRPCLGSGEPGQVGSSAADERPPTALAGLRVDGDAGHGQRLEVAPGGPHRDLQLVGHLGCGHPAPRLEDEERGDETICAHAPHLLVRSGHQVAT